MSIRLQLFLFFFLFISITSRGQLANNCSNAIQVCNNQLAEQLDDGPGTQECPNGGCGCMLAGEKNTRWFKIVVQTGGTLEFTITPYNGVADYDFSVWNQGAGGSCPSGGTLGTPDRCNYAAPQSPTGIRGTTNGNSNSAIGNLFSNNMTVAAGDVIYILVDNWDGTNVGFRLDFFGGAAGSGTGTTAVFNCAGVNTCSTCADPDCKTYEFPSPSAYSFAETAANGACHSNFAVNTKNATVCGTFTVPAPFTTVEFPLDRGVEITASAGNTASCLNVATSHISYQVWGVCGTPLSPVPGTGIYQGLNNVTTYKVCKTVDVSLGSADCYLSRICLPFWTMIQNDEPCGGIALTVNAAAIAGSNAGATSGFNAGCTAYQDVWYKFTAPASGRVQINVVPDASSDVKVSLIGPQAGMTGGVDDCNKPCDQMTNIAGGCNDYAATAGTERLFSFVIPGQTYYVWVSGTQQHPTANFTIQVTETITNTAVPTPGPDIVGAPDVIPANDACANAIDLNPMCNVVPGTNLGATAVCTDPDPQYVAAITLENDVWYKWTAPANNGNAQVTLEVTNANCTQGAGSGALGIQFGIFKGTCGSLTPVSSGTTTLTFTPVSGQTYYFVIDGNAGAQCTFSINIKRPTITAQTCNTGNFCAGSNLSSSFSYTYSGNNPGFKWAYCKSGTFGSPCTIDLDNPGTYSIYNSATGLPSPGCTPSTYTFVGYILADNGATTIAPGYPTPQPSSANCVRSTNPCTFNIYPDIKGTVTVTTTPCSQIVTANGACSPAAPITITGTASQTATPGTNGTFTPVTVTWNATYLGSAPAACKTYTVQNTYACPGPAGADSCSSAPMLVVGGAPITSNNFVKDTSAEWLNECGVNDGSGVWFTFVAPNSGNAVISVTNVSSTLDPIIFLFSSRKTNIPDGIPDGSFYSDICASCLDLSSPNVLTSQKKLEDQLLFCWNNSLVAGGSETMKYTYGDLNPGEVYYIMIDGDDNSFSYPSWQGTFSIQVRDTLNSIIRPVNDNCIGAIDLSSIGCNLFPGTNVNATSLCSNDLPLPGATTENSVWYTYTASVTGPHVIQYKYAIGTHCAAIGAQPGIQFGLYTSSDNTCNGTFTNIPSGTVSTGTINGTVTVNLTAGQKYYILIDGYGGNECNYLFQIYNGNTCCTANLGSTEGSDKVLCFGDDVTYGVSANPIDFGANAQSNPVIGWQLSTTKPTVNNPFDSTNKSKSYLVGNIDTLTSGLSDTIVYRDVKGNYPVYDTTLTPKKYGYDIYDPSFGVSQGFYSVSLSGFPVGSTFNTATDTITVCINASNYYFSDVAMDLIAPDGTKFPIIFNKCGSSIEYLNVCFTNKIPSGTPANISTAGCAPANAIGEIAGYYLPIGAWAGLNGISINGTWKLRVKDTASLDYTYFYGFSVDIKKPVITPHHPIINSHHGDLHIVNNDPFKYGSQVFWLTPVTFVNYNSATNTLTADSCYSYGQPVKVSMLEKMTIPKFTPTCNAPGDGSAGISMTVQSPDGGWPSLTPKAVPAQHFIYTGTGAASTISFPSPPVDTLETSNPFTVLNGQAWSVQFSDSNGCKSSVGGTFDKPNVGTLTADTTVCKSDTIPYSVSMPPSLYSKYKITFDFDSYPQDISWVIYDNTNNVVASGGGYASSLGLKIDSTALLDPNKGPYRIEIYDGYGDGLGSGGGSTTGGGSSATNFITIEELLSTGGSNIIFNQSYAFCTPVYCTGPAASIFSQLNINLGTPTGTFTSGVTNLLHSGSCVGPTIAGAITANSNGSGTVNTTAAGVVAGNTYYLTYSFTDQYNCTTNLCQPFRVFPRVSINPTVNCAASPPTVSVNASCPSCNATYIAEYSYDGEVSWTTLTTANFQDIFTYAHVKNLVTGEVACEVSSAKLGDCPTVLPIELMYIKAIPVDNQYIKVSWATASESNTRVFEVLRSTDGVNFVKMGEVNGAGFSNVQHSYAYDDHDVIGGITYYYQVREIDNDNHTQLTNIVNAKLERDKFELISIYPNPMTDKTVITMYSKDAMDMTLNVFNDIGELMHDEQRTLKEGLNEWNVVTENWAKGVYYFILTSNYKPITKQVIKLQ